MFRNQILMKKRRKPVDPVKKLEKLTIEKVPMKEMMMKDEEPDINSMSLEELREFVSNEMSKVEKLKNEEEEVEVFSNKKQMEDAKKELNKNIMINNFMNKQHMNPNPMITKMVMNKKKNNHMKNFVKNTESKTDTFVDMDVEMAKSGMFGHMGERPEGGVTIEELISLENNMTVVEMVAMKNDMPLDEVEFLKEEMDAADIMESHDEMEMEEVVALKNDLSMLEMVAMKNDISMEKLEKVVDEIGMNDIFNLQDGLTKKEVTLIAEEILSVQEVIAIKDSGINMKSEGLKVTSKPRMTTTTTRRPTTTTPRTTQRTTTVAVKRPFMTFMNDNEDKKEKFKMRPMRIKVKRPMKQDNGDVEVGNLAGDNESAKIILESTPAVPGRTTSMPQQMFSMPESDMMSDMMKPGPGMFTGMNDFLMNMKRRRTTQTPRRRTTTPSRPLPTPTFTRDTFNEFMEPVNPMVNLENLKTADIQNEHSPGDYDYTIYDEAVTEAPRDRFPPRVNMADLMLKPEMNKPGMDMMQRPGMMNNPGMSDVMLPEMVKSSMPENLMPQTFTEITESGNAEEQDFLSFMHTNMMKNPGLNMMDEEDVEMFNTFPMMRPGQFVNPGMEILKESAEETPKFNPMFNPPEETQKFNPIIIDDTKVLSEVTVPQTQQTDNFIPQRIETIELMNPDFGSNQGQDEEFFSVFSETDTFEPAPRPARRPWARPVEVRDELDFHPNHKYPRNKANYPFAKRPQPSSGDFNSPTLRNIPQTSTENEIEILPFVELGNEYKDPQSIYTHFAPHDDRPMVSNVNPMLDAINKEYAEKEIIREGIKRLERTPGEVRLGGMSIALPPSQVVQPLTDSEEEDKKEETTRKPFLSFPGKKMKRRPLIKAEQTPTEESLRPFVDGQRPFESAPTRRPFTSFRKRKRQPNQQAFREKMPVAEDRRPVKDVFPNHPISSVFPDRPVSDVFRDIPDSRAPDNFGPQDFSSMFSDNLLKGMEEDNDALNFDSFFPSFDNTDSTFGRDDAVRLPTSAPHTIVTQPSSSTEQDLFVGNPFGSDFLKLEIDQRRFGTNKSEPSIHHIPLGVNKFIEVPSFESSAANPEAREARPVPDRPRRRLYRPPPVLSSYTPLASKTQERSDSPKKRRQFSLPKLKDAMETLPNPIGFVESLVNNQAQMLKRAWKGDRDEAAAAARSFDEENLDWSSLNLDELISKLENMEYPDNDDQ